MAKGKLVPCNGEAHSNPYIDNCGMCAPHWGYCEVPRDYQQCALCKGWYASVNAETGRCDDCTLQEK